jgi:hypothetical protein
VDIDTDSCVFCAIVRGTVTSHLVYDDRDTMAFLDINPASEGHTLVVPKEHAADIFGIDADIVAAVMRTAKLVAGRIDERLRPDGLTLVQTNRPAGWQDVMGAGECAPATSRCPATLLGEVVKIADSGAGLAGRRPGYGPSFCAATVRSAAQMSHRISVLDVGSDRDARNSRALRT